MELFYDILGIPFGYVLRFIFDLTGNYVAAIILFTILCRVFMLPSSISQQKGAAKTQRMQSKIRKIRERYNGDNQKIQQETQALYNREGYNPMNAGCMPLLVQMPIIFGLVAVIYKPLTYCLLIPEDVVATLTTHLKELKDVTFTARTGELVIIENFDRLKGFIAEKYVSQIKNFDFTFFGLQLGQTPSFKTFDKLWAIPILSGISSLASSVYMTITQKRNNPEMGKNPTGGCMMVFMPLMSLYFTFQFPIGIGIYWITSNIVAFIQQVVLSFTHNPRKMVARLMVEETVQRRSKENNRKIVLQKQRNS